MASVKLYDMKANVIGNLELPENQFSVRYSVDIPYLALSPSRVSLSLHQTPYLSSQDQPLTHKQNHLREN